jgi:hypothetical protein
MHGVLIGVLGGLAREGRQTGLDNRLPFKLLITLVTLLKTVKLDLQLACDIHIQKY